MLKPLENKGISIFTGSVAGCGACVGDVNTVSHHVKNIIQKRDLVMILQGIGPPWQNYFSLTRCEFEISINLFYFLVFVLVLGLDLDDDDDGLEFKFEFLGACGR